MCEIIVRSICVDSAVHATFTIKSNTATNALLTLYVNYLGLFVLVAAALG